MGFLPSGYAPNMRIRTNIKRAAAAFVVAGAGLVVGADAAAAQTGIVDFNGLLRLLDVYDLNPLF